MLVCGVFSLNRCWLHVCLSAARSILPTSVLAPVESRITSSQPHLLHERRHNASTHRTPRVLFGNFLPSWPSSRWHYDQRERQISQGAHPRAYIIRPSSLYSSSLQLEIARLLLRRSVDAGRSCQRLQLHSITPLSLHPHARDGWPTLFASQYAVRGNVLERSMELQRRMAAGEKLPFDTVSTRDSATT